MEELLLLLLLFLLLLLLSLLLLYIYLYIYYLLVFLIIILITIIIIIIIIIIIRYEAVFRGKILHTRNHKSEIPLENATEHPLDISSKIHRESDNPLEHH